MAGPVFFSLSLTGGVLAVALAVPVAALAGESVYTDLDLDACETVAIAAEDGGSGEWICPGIEGRAVFVTEGDLRVSGGFGAVPEFQSFAPFNSLDLGPKLLQYGKGIVSLDLCTECFKSSNRIRLHDRISSRKMISST